MLARERHARILDELEHRGSVKVRELVSLLGVSDMTIRRDLEVLRRDGLLDKVHGGATISRHMSTDERASSVNPVYEEPAKEAIAAHAATLVEPGSAVAIGAGSTTLALARHLVGVRGLTVVTNSLWVADELQGSGAADLTVLLTGGMRTASDALVGAVAIRTLQSLHVDIVFLGVHGMDAKAGFTARNLMESETDRAMVTSGRRLVVAADSTRWGVLGLSSIVPLSEAAVVVSDVGLPQDARETLSEQAGQLVLAQPASPTATAERRTSQSPTTGRCTTAS
jgi:DeoR/GlpR family transcriptional regulator of sugar metabolism